MRTALGLVVAGLVACGGADGALEPVPQGPLVLSPDVQLEEVAAKWAADWSAETGLEVTIGDGGVPVLAVDEIVGPDGLLDCGHTELQFTDGVFSGYGAIRIDLTPPPKCVGWGYTLGHEIGHALARSPEHVTSGLMDSSTDRGVAHPVDADYVCSRVECSR